jgi:hypothetical protein
VFEIFLRLVGDSLVPPDENERFAALVFISVECPYYLVCDFDELDVSFVIHSKLDVSVSSSFQRLVERMKEIVRIADDVSKVH